MEVDVVVIGAGVVGSAVARALAKWSAHRLSIVVLERHSSAVAAASAGNSGIFHTGFDAPYGSLEHECMVDGSRQAWSLKERFPQLPLQCTSAVVVAWNDDEARVLPDLLRKAQANGITNCSLLSGDSVLLHEPALAASAAKRPLSALLVPDEGVADPWLLPLFYLRQAQNRGVQLLTDCGVIGGAFDGELWTLSTTRGSLRASLVISCAGNFGDLVDLALLGRTRYHITPRKGQFVVYSSRKPLGHVSASAVQSIVLPVPNERTKGVLVSPTIMGATIVGPTAEDQQEREHAMVSEPVVESLRQHGASLVPGLRWHREIGTYAGLRPASEHRDYQIEAVPERQYISVGGIRSTGLTAALGIASHVERLCEQHFAFLLPTDHRDGDDDHTSCATTAASPGLEQHHLTEAQAEELDQQSQLLDSNLVHSLAWRSVHTVSASSQHRTQRRPMSAVIDGQPVHVTHRLNQIAWNAIPPLPLPLPHKL